MLLSTPSYVIPGTYLENLVFLSENAPLVTAVELLFFFFDKETESLFLSERRDILPYKERFRFSVHMPDILEPWHERIIELTQGLADHYVIHTPPEENRDAFVSLVTLWRERYGDVFYLENLIGRDFRAIYSMFDSIPVCCDTGHLLLNTMSPRDFLDSYGTRIREIHLHGIKDGRDHTSFPPDAEWFLDCVPFLREFTGRLNIEVFSFEEVQYIAAHLLKEKIFSENIHGYNTEEHAASSRQSH